MSDARRRVYRILGACAIILALAQSTYAVIQANTNASIVNRRSVTIDALAAYDQRQECRTQLSADLGRALADITRTREDTPERFEALRAFQVAGDALQPAAVKSKCTDPFPLPKPDPQG